MTDERNAIIRLVVNDDHAATRLDRFIAGEVNELSRQRVQSLIKSREVSVDDAICADANYKVRHGQEIVLTLPEPAPTDVLAEPIPLDIVFEDPHLIVINKPAGLVTHPAPGHATGTLVNGLLSHIGDGLSGIGGVLRPGIVHRLDKDTSGLLVVAKSDAAHKGLAEQFAAHGADGRLQRSYTAFVWGGFDRPRGSVDAPLARSATNRRKIAITSEETGRHAVTHYLTERQFKAGNEIIATRLKLTLETGRTHQIRVHMTSIQHPLLGDPTYGAGFKASAAKLPTAAQEALAALGRQALHAALLAFEHPVTGEAMRFDSPLPADIDRLNTALDALD